MGMMMEERPTGPLPGAEVLDAETLGVAIEKWLIGILQTKGAQTLDQLGLLLPSQSWAQLFLAVDRLTRGGAVTLRSNGRGEYVLHTRPQNEERPFVSDTV